MIDGYSYREYQPEDLKASLRVFDTNVPRYFKSEEREEFRSFLDEMPGPYLVLVDPADEVVGCGGYAISRDEGLADLCWGMVRQDRHGGGLGRYLTRLRLERCFADRHVKEIALHTSQHTVGFYERLGFSVTSVQEDGYAPGLHRCDMSLSTGYPREPL
jgi:ribosomal protein S18 acetylase RimI-like enzyme